MSTSLQAPAGAMAPNARIQSWTLLSVCLLPAPGTDRPGKLSGLSSGMLEYFGEATLEPSGSLCPCEDTKEGGTGQGEVLVRGTRMAAPHMRAAVTG